MSEYLFAYGTLQPGFAPESMAALVARLTPVGEGFVRGVLYDLGEFPGAVLEAGAAGRIYGTVLRLPEGRDVLPELDAYEGFELACPKASLFTRSTCSVQMTAGGILDCWIYGYNRPLDGLPVLGQGRYLGRHSTLAP
jgi:gamma-glutamylcyclotransferase (GGCT)/AIG2-like uncharacterized protein YtfP